MSDLFIAFGRSMRSLFRLDVFWHLIWPGIVAAAFWFVVAFFSWASLTGTIMDIIEGAGWVGDKIAASAVMAAIVLFLIKLLVVLAFVPLFYVTTAVIVGTVALPMMLNRVAARDYADLELRRGGSDMGSIANTLLALLWFLLGLFLSLPLWLIPGVAFVAPVLATAWLNQRIFGYDALMRHADRDELLRLREALRSQLLLLGGGTALLVYIPVINIVAPAFSGLAFVHYLLEALRRERGVTLLPQTAGARLR